MKTRGWVVVAAGVVTLAGAAGASSVSVTPRSYEEVRDHVLAHPLNALPDRGPVSVVDFVRAAFTGTGRVMERGLGLFRERTDLRPSATKLTHAPGVCGEATLDIGQSPLTGMLASNTHLPALVRISSATNGATDDGKGRSFGLALKVFPSLSTTAPVLSANLVTSDQFGLNGLKRQSVFSLPAEHGPLHFLNFIGGAGFEPDLAARALRRVSPNVQERPIYPFTTVSADGQPVKQPVTPERLHFVVRKPREVPAAADFRAELQQYESGELVFDVYVPPQTTVPDGASIGTLTLGKLMVTDACDLELSFFHHPMDPAKNPQ